MKLADKKEEKSKNGVEKAFDKDISSLLEGIDSMTKMLSKIIGEIKDKKKNLEEKEKKNGKATSKDK